MDLVLRLNELLFGCTVKGFDVILFIGCGFTLSSIVSESNQIEVQGIKAMDGTECPNRILKRFQWKMFGIFTDKTVCRH